jgi:hypothetical protein
MKDFPINKADEHFVECHLKDNKLVKYLEKLGKEKEKKMTHAPYLTMSE